MVKKIVNLVGGALMCATGESVPVGALADLEARVAAAVGLD